MTNLVFYEKASPCDSDSKSVCTDRSDGEINHCHQADTAHEFCGWGKVVKIKYGFFALLMQRRRPIRGSRRAPSSWGLALAIAGTILGMVGCSANKQQDSPAVSDLPPSGVKAANFAASGTTASHERMLAILKRIKERLHEDHSYYGRGKSQRMQQELARLDPTGDMDQFFKALCSTGIAELRYEVDPRKAIGHLTQANELLPEVTFADSRQLAGLSVRINFYLGVAHLRLGETENCCLRHTSESCILPIQGAGIHTNPEGSKNAIKYFLRILGGNTDDTDNPYYETSRWLLNIAYMTLGQYPEQVPKQFLIPTEFFQSDVDFPRFENIAPKLGLNTFNHAGGAIVDDFDNDDYLDIFTTSSCPDIECRWFRNNQDGTFTDRTEEAGLTGLYGGLNVVQADYNNDGHLDVYIMRGAWQGAQGRHPNSLLRNNGNSTFTDVTFDAGLGEAHFPSKTAAWADFDNDGHLDLYVGNEAGPDFSCPSQLFRNNGDGTFKDVSVAIGANALHYSMGAVWGDINNDRFPDLYAAGPPRHRLFLNHGGTSFVDVAAKLNLLRPNAAFATWFWDFDNDGVLDLYVSSSNGFVGTLARDALGEDLTKKSNGPLLRGTNAAGRVPHMQFELAALYRGNGSGGFDEVARQRGLTTPTLPMGANFGDINGDGFLDFYLATGDVHFWELQPNLMFLNQGGERFANVTMAGGFGHLQKGHGVCFADIDNDGDQDVYVQTGGQLPADKFNDALFENPGFDHRWISVKLVGRRSNRSAIGAKIRVQLVENGESRSVYRHVNSGGSFGCNPLRQNIGLGKAEKIEILEVYWPTSDSTQTFHDVAMDRSIQIVEGEDAVTIIDTKPLVLGGK